MAAAAGGAALEVGGAYIAGENAKIAANYNKEIQYANASMMEQQADRQYKINLEQAQTQRKQTAKLVGSQRAALAAQGVDVNDGSALEAQEETEILGAEDSRRIETNAYLEALGMKSQAQQVRNQADYGVKSARNQANNSLLTAGLSAASRFTYSMPSGGKAGNSAGSSGKDYSNLA